MLQRETPDDFVIATGEMHSVKEFCIEAIGVIGKTLTWSGEGIGVCGTDQDGVVRVRVDKRYFRPTEVELLIGDPAKAKKLLGWVPEIKFQELVQEMVREDIKLLQKA